MSNEGSNPIKGFVIDDCPKDVVLIDIFLPMVVLSMNPAGALPVQWLVVVTVVTIPTGVQNLAHW